ncbi:MAG: hypothetical protein LC732_12610, partial [Acidobacteria bacterium]|nr:hypothetical protein [Acidobacteriota bacterium]
VYGDLRAPSALGAGGGGAASCCTRGGAGGGAISIAPAPGAAEVLFAIAGVIGADGESGVSRGGAGAGGSIRLDAGAIVTGALARIRANGGDDDAFSNGSAGGGGGRVAIAASMRLDLLDGVAQARGGRNSGSELATRLGGGAGTVFVERPGSTDGALVVSSFDERYATTLHQTRPTPLSGDALIFDALTAGPRALLRIDDPVIVGGLTDDRSTMTIDPSGVVLLAADVPSLSVTTAPLADSALIQATTLAPTYEASSPAGIGSVRLEWSALAQPRIDTTPAYPPILAPAPVALQVPHDAAPGAATLRLVAEDRAGRSVSSETLAYTIVENAPPQITAFDATPAALYPGATATLVAAASDDVKITTLTLRALIGET